MTEALAHEAVFPHIHPHPKMSAIEDISWTLLFLVGIIAAGKVFIALYRRWMATTRKPE